MKCISVLLLSAAALAAQNDGNLVMGRTGSTAKTKTRSGIAANAAKQRAARRSMGKTSAMLQAPAPSVAAPGGATFTTGQAARLVIGQTTFTSQDPNSSDTILGAAGGIAYAGDTLFVADSNRLGATPVNHRILLFKGLSSMLPAPSAELSNNSKCPVCVGAASLVLGQPDFTTNTLNLTATSSSLRAPTAVASDGVHLVVADTDHNRVLIWNHIPTSNNQPADVVVGQPNFTSTTASGSSPTAKSLSGPEGVWIQNGKLYIADTDDDRVLIYNTIPTANGAAADVVLGQPNFTTHNVPELSQNSDSTDVTTTSTATATNMLSPVSVSSDGVRLFVTDLGYNRVLVWNTIPTSNAAAASFAIGQPDLNHGRANDAYTTDSTNNNKQAPVLCTQSNGTDSNGNATYPAICNATLNFPRFALSTGTQLFIADGGNDRVLVFNHIPNQSGASADLIIGQIGGDVDQATDAADSVNTPTSLAWDGLNLYVSDPYNRRITVYTPASATVPYQGVTNSATTDVIANGTVTIGGTIKANDVVTITIAGTNYTYTVKATDTIASVVQALVNAINSSNSGGGDPNVIATADTSGTEVVLTSRTPGSAGNNTTYSATVSSGATVTATAANANLSGGADAAKVAPGTLVTIQGCIGWASCNLSAGSASADLSKPQLPTKLGGTQVYFNGIPAPLLYVSPFQINAQIPWEVVDTTSINAYVRSEMPDGSVMTTTPVAVSIVPANPGIYTQSGTNPAMAVAFHGSSSAVGLVSVDGTITANDVATITVQDRSYSYTVQAGDTLDTVRDNLIALINNGDPVVTAYAAGEYDRIVLQARVQGPIGNTITMGASASSGATLIITPFGTTLCCANVEGAPITAQNPAAPGEFIELYATGLGLPVLTDTVSSLLVTGAQWPANGPQTQPPDDTPHAVSSLAGGKTADVISASLLPGSVGVYKIVLHLNSALPTTSAMPITIAQDTFVSNIAYVPVSGQ
ncbi:MAG TPA: hypothetical protein VKX45_06540 [Bryobacteraceae bacterium]|nr:hypothetical protein [Bryobacteraceae bacterium]